MPVAMGRMLGSKMMSSGSKPAFSVRSPYARPQISTLRSNVSAWPVSSNAITTAAAPYLRTSRACSRKDSSPPLRLIELATPLPWRHLRPASRTVNLELSTITGIRAISGSVAMRLRNRTMAASESRRSASMLTSSMFAPPRTWSSATWTAPAKSPDSMRRRNRIEPVTLVRSPITTKPESGPVSKGSRPLEGGRGERLRVLDRCPEGLNGLAGEVAPASVDDRDRDEQRNLGRDFLHRGDGGLAVQRVEDGLNEEDVDAAFLQRAGCLRVAVAKLVERDIAIRRIVDSR